MLQKPTSKVEWADKLLTRVLELVSDPAFVEFEFEQEAPSIFNAVGRTHTETWHSAFLGWLLNPASSHLLGTFPLTRFILLLKSSDNRAIDQRSTDLDVILVQGDFSNVVAWPNERQPKEKRVPGVGRFDVLVDLIDLAPWHVVQILIEMKVESKIDVQQADKYIDYVQRSRDLRNTAIIPVFVAPDSEFARAPRLFNDGSWIPIDFQSLVTDVVEPCLQHPSISDFAKYALTEYLRTLKHPTKGGAPLAITQKERELLDLLLDKHRTTIDAIFRILNDRTGSYEAVDSTPSRGPLQLTIGSTTLEAPSVPVLYKKLLTYIDAKGKLIGVQVPVQTGPKRHLINDEPKHADNSEFIKQVEYKGYYMEGNKSRRRAKIEVEGLLRHTGIDEPVIFVSGFPSENSTID